MKSYKLKKTYPGSPLLGHVIVNTSCNYVTIQPQKFPEYWEEIPSETFVITEDGVELCEGETCWTFNSNCTVTNFIITKYYLGTNSSNPVFSTKEAAIKYLTDEINIPTEDGQVVGFNVPIYSLLPKANWEQRETTSLELWIRIKMGRNIGNWKYFKKEEERDLYIYRHKPLYSMGMLLKAFNSVEIPRATQAKIIAHICRD